MVGTKGTEIFEYLRALDCWKTYISKNFGKITLQIINVLCGFFCLISFMEEKSFTFVRT